MGLTGDDLQVHLHAVNEYHTHNKKEGTDVDPEYKPAWPKENGIQGRFATVNIKPGTNVSLHLHAYDTKTKKDVEMKQFGLSFFDLDTGVDNNHSVEYIHIGGFDHYFLTNESEVNVKKLEDGTYIFMATKEGNGDDNPKNPNEMNVLQKNRAVSFQFSNTKDVKFEVGASPGKTARVFEFALRPALRCSKTKMEDGTLLAPDSPKSPVTILKGSASRAGRSVAIIATAFT